MEYYLRIVKMLEDGCEVLQIMRLDSAKTLNEVAPSDGDFIDICGVEYTVKSILKHYDDDAYVIVVRV